MRVRCCRQPSASSRTAESADVGKLTGIASRFAAFITERYPFALAEGLDAFESATGGRVPGDEASLNEAGSSFKRVIRGL